MQYDDYDYDVDELSEDSFWPSFTDIMMVIVMVFLLVTVVTILKNWQLVSHLKTSIEAEFYAKVSAEEERIQKMTLQQQLDSLKQSNFGLTLQLKQRDGQLQSLNQRLTETLSAEQSLQLRYQDLAVKNQQDMAQLQSQKSQLTETIASLTASKNDLATQLASSLKDNQSKQASLQDKLDQQSQLIAEHDDELERLRSIEGEYQTLDKKYQKLLKPQRSSKGKTQVSITYRKRGGNEFIGFKGVSNKAFKNISRSRLHAALKDLKQVHGDDLYVKLVFPVNNNLSYNESMSFTREFQHAYDYYYQNND